MQSKMIKTKTEPIIHHLILLDSENVEMCLKGVLILLLFYPFIQAFRFLNVDIFFYKMSWVDFGSLVVNLAYTRHSKTTIRQPCIHINMIK